MKYTFCSLSLGEEYIKDSINFVESLNKISYDHHMIIVKDLDINPIPNTTIYDLPSHHKKITHGLFNYNLKFLPIKYACESGYDYVIFIDADWKLEEGYKTECIYRVFEEMEKRDIDMFFERPHIVGKSKFERDSFIRHKVPVYNLLDTTEFDEAHVPNEQFLVFRNNYKLKSFVSYWEELNQKCLDVDCWAFAEGLEIGMSAVKAGMNISYTGWQHLLPNHFSFMSKGGIFYKRF